MKNIKVKFSLWLLTKLADYFAKRGNSITFFLHGAKAEEIPRQFAFRSKDPQSYQYFPDKEKTYNYIMFFK